ncbi:unnamed protein product, partial [marine sediment metagenome]
DGDVDLMAEVYVGRASAENAAEFSNFVYKTMGFENADAGDEYLRGVLLAGQFLGNQFGPDMMAFGKAYMKELKEGSTATGYTTIGFDSCELFNVSDLYQWDNDQAGESRWGASDMVAEMSSNSYAIVNHIGHGSADFGFNIRNTDAMNLTNDKFFFAQAQDCTPGKLEVDCLAERLTTSTRHGAYAVVLNSRYGFGWLNDYPWSSFDGGSQRGERQFWDAYFAEFIINLGAINADSHEDCIFLL